MFKKKIFVFFILSNFSPIFAIAQENPEKTKSRPFGMVELTSNLIEDGYTQTGNSFGLLTDVGYAWEQFNIGIRGNNVYFEGERAHLTLKPHLAILANFSDFTKFFIEHEERFYFNDSLRNGGRSSVGLKFDEFLFRYESLINWWGLDFTKSRFSLNYEYVWDQEYSSDFQLGYNIVEEANTRPFFDSSLSTKFRKDQLEYYAEIILLSDIVKYIPAAQKVSFRIGLKTHF